MTLGMELVSYYVFGYFSCYKERVGVESLNNYEKHHEVFIKDEKRPKTYQSDNEAVLHSHELNQKIISKGWQKIPVRPHRSSGGSLCKLDNMGMQVLNLGRVLMYESCMHYSLWPLALAHAMFILNNKPRV